MRWKLVTWLTVRATNLSDWLLRKRNWNYTAADYRSMPENSMGKKLITYMDQNNIPFKPNLVRHDLKHVLLGYKMNMPDELRIHAFLIGNRCYNPMAMTYLAICVVIVPEIIPTLRKDFKRGKNSVCLRNIALEKYTGSDLTQCQRKWKLTEVSLS
jgi:hypothetical protein